MMPALAGTTLLATSMMLIGGPAYSQSLVRDFVFAEENHDSALGFRDLVANDFGAIPAMPEFREVAGYAYIPFGGDVDHVALNATPATLPTDALTVAAWVRVDATTEWGGIIGAFQDNGGFEKGWVLGYDNNSFTMGLASTGADDGDGVMTYLDSNMNLSEERWHHVAATYDGTTMRIYVNGAEGNSTTAQSGAILYPATLEYNIGRYKDVNENNLLVGAIHQVSVWDAALSAGEIKGLFDAKAALAESSGNQDPDLEFVVAPYLQYPTPTTMVVRWESSKDAESIVEYGLEVPLGNTATGNTGVYNEVTLSGLQPDTAYHYRVRSTTPIGGNIKSDIFHFRTPPAEETAFNFVVICDTQSNPQVVNTIANLAYRHRPAFTLLGGDLVTDGRNKSHWTEHFFPNMAALNSNVPLIPALGNHENNADFYYDYFTMPAPEYYYKFSYSNLDVFVLDSEKDMGPGSEQYQWLDQQLAESAATWKIIMHHKPPYSSDENDYGDTYTRQSSYGDTRMRPITALYDQYDVDIVWSGHIHTYERTFPMEGGAVVAEGGTVYMITGGGGGGLEYAAPSPPRFSANTLNDHHYTHVMVNGGQLSAHVYDVQGRLFDTFTLEK